MIVKGINILVGDCLERMKEIPDQTAHCCVTSPPYFGLRDYGHQDQIGAESTPGEFVARLVDVFREVRRVLRDDGTLWLNLGDSYGTTGGNTYSGFNERWNGTGGPGSKQDRALDGVTDRVKKTGLAPKNLLGIPWRVAFALQADGWYLRQDIIWHKPNPMPESVTDRCTKSHEYIFLLSKSERYHFDSAAIQEVAWSAGRPRQFGASKQEGTYRNDVGRVFEDSGLRNKRSVWSVSVHPFSGAHFATFPPDLIMPCILAGCPEDGTVLDPFGGAGTTGLVAQAHNRNAILCELNPSYAEMAEKRIRDEMPMFADVKRCLGNVEETI